VLPSPGEVLRCAVSAARGKPQNAHICWSISMSTRGKEVMVVKRTRAVCGN